MDLLDRILLSVAGGIATSAGQHVFERLKHYLNELFKDNREHKILKALEDIGNLADRDIRRRVEEFARLQKLPAGQAEELSALLINLTHGVRFHTTNGNARSSFLRCERLLDQLLNRVLPKRRKG